MAKRANLTSLVRSTNFTETGFPEAKHELLGFAVQLHFCDSKNFTNRKREDITDQTVLSSLFLLVYGFGLAQVRLTNHMRCSHFCQISNSPLRASRISMPLFDFIYDYAKMQERAPRARGFRGESAVLLPEGVQMYVEREKTAVVNKNIKKEENHRFSTAVLLEDNTKKIRGTELPIPLNCFYLRLPRNTKPDHWYWITISTLV